MWREPPPFVTAWKQIARDLYDAQHHAARPVDDGSRTIVARTPAPALSPTRSPVIPARHHPARHHGLGLEQDGRRFERMPPRARIGTVLPHDRAAIERTHRSHAVALPAPRACGADHGSLQSRARSVRSTIPGATVLRGYRLDDAGCGAARWSAEACGFFSRSRAWSAWRCSIGLTFCSRLLRSGSLVELIATSILVSSLS